jgi:hypothetical protein
MERIVEKIIANFTSEVDAEIAREYLRIHGIDAFIRSDDAGHMLPSLQGTQGVRLMVASVDEEKARECLESGDS